MPALSSDQTITPHMWPPSFELNNEQWHTNLVGNSHVQVRIYKSGALGAETDQALVRELQLLFFKNANQINNETFLEKMKEKAKG